MTTDFIDHFIATLPSQRKARRSLRTWSEGHRSDWGWVVAQMRQHRIAPSARDVSLILEGLAADEGDADLRDYEQLALLVPDSSHRIQLVRSGAWPHAHISALEWGGAALWTVSDLAQMPTRSALRLAWRVRIESSLWSYVTPPGEVGPDDVRLTIQLLWKDSTEILGDLARETTRVLSAVEDLSLRRAIPVHFHDATLEQIAGVLVRSSGEPTLSRGHQRVLYLWNEPRREIPEPVWGLTRMRRDVACLTVCPDAGRPCLHVCAVHS